MHGPQRLAGAIPPPKPGTGLSLRAFTTSLPPTGLMSAALFGHALTLNFAIGVSIVFISM